MNSLRCLAANKDYPTTYICIFNQTRLKKEREGLVNTDTLIILVIMSQPRPMLKVLPQSHSLLWWDYFTGVAKCNYKFFAFASDFAQKKL